MLGMGVAEMLERLGSSEIAEWISRLDHRDKAEAEAISAAKRGAAPTTFRGA
jgi:uncharacterized protein YjaZ